MGDVTVGPFGATPAGAAELVVLRGERLELGVATLGAAVHVLRAAGGPDLVLGLPDAEASLADQCYVGAVVGRFANRIAGGQLDLDGRRYRLPTNDGPHTLHGGPDGFHRRLWQITRVAGGERPRVELALVSPDGDMGFPGRLTATAAYTLEDWTVRVELTATTEAATVVNLTQHAYWHLGALDVRDHELSLAASRYLPVDDDGIPTGAPVPVAGTPYDLRGGGLLRGARGAVLDHCYVLDEPGLSRPFADLRDPGGGWSLRVSSDAPAVQVYTGAALTGAFAPHRGLCLETQWLPDSPHHQGEPGWPSTVLRPGRVWASTTLWQVGPPGV